MNNQPPKNFIQKLFCKHEWVRTNDLKLYEDSYSTRPSYHYERWECKKCLKIKRRRIL